MDTTIDMKENTTFQDYRECCLYRKFREEAAERSNDAFTLIKYDDPGLEITLDRDREKKYQKPCDTTWWDYDPTPCDFCPFSGHFLTAPKMTPYLSRTEKFMGSLFAETCDRFGFDTKVIKSTGQIWMLDLRRVMRTDIKGALRRRRKLTRQDTLHLKKSRKRSKRASTATWLRREKRR